MPLIAVTVAPACEPSPERQRVMISTKRPMLTGFLADEQRLGAMNELGDAGAPVSLAEAGEAGVGLDANEDPGKVAVDDGGADVGDLHARALVLGQAVRVSWVSESKRWSFSWSNAIQTGSSGRIGICGSRLTTMTAEPR